LLDYLLTVAILAVGALVAARLDRVATHHPTGTAIVNDGDTITVAGERIRLQGIDAPELAQSCTKAGSQYACGRLSRDALAELVRGRAVACSGWERDRYGRLLARCKVDGRDLGQAQVDAGWAVAYGDYHEAERAARDERAGLWAGSFERPGDWRAHRGFMMEAEHDIFARIVNWLREITGIDAGQLEEGRG